MNGSGGETTRPLPRVRAPLPLPRPPDPGLGAGSGGGPRIALVGAGTAGAALVNALACAPPAGGGELLVVDPTEDPWRGRVFRADGAWVICNSPLRGMSVRPEDPDHAVRWLDARRPDAGPDTPPASATFVPRAVYGDYLREATADAVARLGGHGWTVSVLPRRAVRLRREESGLWLDTDDGRRTRCDTVVLAPGGDAGSDPYGLAGSPGYVDPPYPVDKALADVAPGASVGVVGTGLTAVDVVLGLAEQGHRGPVTLFSRSGLLPGVRASATEPVPLTVLVPERMDLLARRSPLSLDAVRGLLDEELRPFGCDVRRVAGDTRGGTALDRIDRRLSSPPDGRDLGLRVLQQALPAVGQDLWYLMSPQARRWTREHLQRVISALCCPMPRVNARRLAALLGEGRVRTVSGVGSIRPRPPHGFTVVSGDGARVVVDVVVNAVTPARRHVPRAARSLVERASADGLLLPHPFGGVCVERTTSRALDSTGRAQSDVHVLGELTFGAFHFVSGVPVLVNRAAQITADLGAAVGGCGPDRRASGRGYSAILVE
ncbi:FAD/NAD(P)-binding protein (plasmid) [Streptomyces sp. BI20]|uniref:FAD/NAD(P)-binding protein n=1 Tax=Streptomyces sp. BI20 TaxID=3403460 RepID=UPI003C792759